jgi:hypothetical protein
MYPQLKNLPKITVFTQDTFGNIGASETISFTIAKPESEIFPVLPVAAFHYGSCHVGCWFVGLPDQLLILKVEPFLKEGFA